mmetsp:Transcript_11368/g.34150  ORF Transcript_11368/g.34150 Transcript_11368/m.34150 type:complete len:264 (+) Transcript_11368:1503-2294(+)
MVRRGCASSPPEERARCGPPRCWLGPAKGLLVGDEPPWPPVGERAPRKLLPSVRHFSSGTSGVSWTLGERTKGCMRAASPKSLLSRGGVRRGAEDASSVPPDGRSSTEEPRRPSQDWVNQLMPLPLAAGRGGPGGLLPSGEAAGEVGSAAGLRDMSRGLLRVARRIMASATKGVATPPDPEVNFSVLPPLLRRMLDRSADVMRPPRGMHVTVTGSSVSASLKCMERDPSRAERLFWRLGPREEVRDGGPPPPPLLSLVGRPPV